MKTILNEKIVIHGRRIQCKVIGSSFPNNKPYMLCMQGGPGFGFTSMELGLMARLIQSAKQAKAEIPNLIFYDPVGCGDSDPAQDVAAEYSVQNYTELAACVIEAVKQRLSPNTPMDLRICGGSYGAITVMDLPVHRPDWLDGSSDIRLREIISIVGPNGANTKNYARQYVRDNFSEHPKFSDIQAALEKLLNGKIKDQDDYLHSIIYHLAPLYAVEHEKKINSLFGKLLMRHPNAVIAALKGINRIAQNNNIQLMIDGLTGCSLDVLNQFFSSDLNGLDLIQQVRDNRALYSKVSLCLIANRYDHMVDPNTAITINKLLPETSAVIIIKDRHQSKGGPSRELMNSLLLGLTCQGKIPDSVFDSEMVDYHVIGDSFKQVLFGLTEPIQVPSSTTTAFQVLSATTIVENEVISNSEASINDNDIEESDTLVVSSENAGHAQHVLMKHGYLMR